MALHDWYRKLTADVNDYSSLIDIIDYYEKEIIKAKNDVALRGNLEVANKYLPGLVEHRFSQLQEIEAMLEYINIRYQKVKGERFRSYLEKYNRELSSRDAEKFAEADDEVIKIAQLRNEVALLRNQFLAIMKGLEQKSFSITNITKLRCAGLDDVELGN